MKKLSKKLLSVLLVVAMLVPTGVLMVNTNAAKTTAKKSEILYDFEYVTGAANKGADNYIPSYTLPTYSATWLSENAYGGYSNRNEFEAFLHENEGWPLYMWPNSACGDSNNTAAKATIVSSKDGEPVCFGNKSLRIDFDYSNWNHASNGNIYLRTTTPTYKFEGKPTAIGIWVYAPEGTTPYNLYLQCSNNVNPVAGTYGGSSYQSITTPEVMGNNSTGISWTGWKYLEFDLTGTKGYPAALKVGSNYEPYGYSTGEGVFWISYQPSNMGNIDFVPETIYLDNITLIYGEDNTDSLIPDDAVMFNGHYYKAYDISMAWTDAKAYCENLGGHLVTVTSQAEQTFLENTFFTTASEMWFYMIGGYRESYTSTKWMWVTGEPFNFSNWSTPNEPTQEIWGQNYIWAFSPSAPDSYVRDDGVVIEVPDYKWVSNESACYHEVYNTNHTGFICEWDANKYAIAGRTFDKNIDYFTSYTLSSEYNPELANMTAALSRAVYNEKKIEDAYTSLGFPFCERLDDIEGAFNPYSSAYSIGVKKSEYNEDMICLIAVRGSSNFSDWVGNLSIWDCDSDGKLNGFGQPAYRIYNTIQKLFDNNISGNVKFVITGHSRGAAIANLLSVLLMENGISPTDIYNYNFACPDVACKVSFKEYINIFNLCNREDVVPFVPGNTFSFVTWPGHSWGKFGQTYWFTKDTEDDIGTFADHDMELYLEFFDQQKMPEEWGRSFWDKVDDNVHWTFGWISKILCPVDVIVTDTDGNKIASVIDDEVNYYDSNFGDVIIFTDGDKKAIFVSGDKDFNIELIGTDDGTMTYAVEKCNLMTEEILESKTFENVKLENGKEMYSPVSNAETTDDIELFVVEDENGEDVKTHTINTDGSETEIYHIYETLSINPTCTEKGYTLHTCINCDDSYEDEYIDALGHTDENSDGVCDACSEDFTKSCSCSCHGNSFIQFLFKIITFLRKLFGMEEYHYCDCGKAHW